MLVHVQMLVVMKFVLNNDKVVCCHMCRIVLLTNGLFRP